MKKLLTTLPLVAMLLLAGCGKSHKRDFNHLLVELAGEDRLIDGADWDKIEKYLDREKSHFADLYKDGCIDAEATKEYIADFFANRRPATKVRFTGIGESQMAFHFYIERSGSMLAYDSPKGDGSFRAAIMALRNALPGNSQVDSIGEKGYTDFRQIFDNILNKTGEGDVSILVTDLIYSVRDMQGVNPQKVFAEMQEMINSVFKDEVKHKSMLVVRMNGSYNGTYYAFDNSVHRFDGNRPYYIIIVGSNDNIAQLASSPDFRTFSNLESLRGYDGMCLFTADDIYEPYASFLLSGRDIRGRFKPEHGQGDQILRLESVKPDRDSGDIQLALAVDLSHMFIDSRYLTDKSNYRLESDGDIKIKEIRQIQKADITPAEKKYIGSATHLFILTAKNIGRNDDVKLSLLNRLPQWASTGSTDNDLRPDNHSTFGLRYLMQGIYDSYARNAEDNPEYFEIEIKLDR